MTSGINEANRYRIESRPLPPAPDPQGGELRSGEHMQVAAYHVRCWRCGKDVSSPVMHAIVVRAFVECPECISKTTLPAPAASPPPAAAVTGLLDRLKEAAELYWIQAEYDCPGDTPELCGYVCGECKGDGLTESDVEHEPGCFVPLALALTVPAQPQAETSERQFSSLEGVEILGSGGAGRAALADIRQSTEIDALTSRAEAAEAERDRLKEERDEAQRELADLKKFVNDAADDGERVRVG